MRWNDKNSQSLVYKGWYGYASHLGVEKRTNRKEPRMGWEYGKNDDVTQSLAKVCYRGS